MPHKTTGCLLASMLLLLATGVHAGTFDAANSTLEVTLGTLPPITLSANPGGAASGPGPVVTAFGTPTKPFGPVNVDLPDSLFTGVPQIVDLRFNGFDNPQGTSGVVYSSGAGLNGGFGGIAALSGSTTICAFSCPFGLQIQVPLGVIGGSGTTFFTTALGVPLTVTPSPGWTTGQAALTGLGGMTPTVAVTGTNNLTANGAGSVTLVTPVKVNVGAIGQILPLFAVQHLEFAVEPTSTLLLGSAITTLMMLGRRKLRS
jgi:hypothetical protein